MRNCNDTYLQGNVFFVIISVVFSDRISQVQVFSCFLILSTVCLTGSLSRLFHYFFALAFTPSSRQRERETKQRRAARASSRGVGIGSGADVERAFLLGLVDACPRCGESLEGYPDEAEQRRHLMECTDTRKHAAHRKEQGKLQAKAAAKEAKRDAQDSAQVQCGAERKREIRVKHEHEELQCRKSLTNKRKSGRASGIFLLLASRDTHLSTLYLL